MAKPSVYIVTSSRGGISDYENKGIEGAFKFGSNLDIRKEVDSISCGQALKDIGNENDSPSASVSPSASRSPSASSSPSPSASPSPSSSPSPSPKSPSSSISPSASRSPSASASPSSSASPSHSPSPSTSPSAGLNSVFSDLILFFVPCSDGNLYGFGNTGKVYKINEDLYVSQVYDLGKPISGAAEKPSSNGNTYLAFASRTEVHHKLIPGRSDWNDVNRTLENYPKTNLTSVDWHTMKQVGGDILIANGSNIAFIGYDDSYTNDALQIIPGNTAKTIVERNGRAIIGTYRTGQPNKGINAAIDAEVPLVQVGDNGDIYFANGVDSIPYKRFPGGGKVNPGGVVNLDQLNIFDWDLNALSWIDKQELANMAYFGVYGADEGKGGIYTIGRKQKNHPFVMNLEYALDVDEIGAVARYNDLTFVSYREGSSFGVKVVDNSAKAQGTWDGLDFKAPVKKPIDITSWDIVELFMAPLPNGASVEFWYKMDKTGSFIRAKTIDESNSFTTANAKKAVFKIGAEGQIISPRIVLNPVGNQSPEIYRTIIYFK